MPSVYTNTPNEKSEMKINYDDARILRHALASLATSSPPALSRVAMIALKEYAVRVSAYCEHPEQARTQKNSLICIDCGFESPYELNH